MFGLREASRADGKDPAKGLYEQLDITELYARLAASPGWDAKNPRIVRAKEVGRRSQDPGRPRQPLCHLDAR